MKRVWSFTFTPIGFGVSMWMGCGVGAAYNASRPAPMRYLVLSPDWDDPDNVREYTVSDKNWILEGMWYGALAGGAVNLFWPVLLVGGIPLGSVYYGAKMLQQQMKMGGL